MIRHNIQISIPFPLEMQMRRRFHVQAELMFLWVGENFVEECPFSEVLLLKVLG